MTLIQSIAKRHSCRIKLPSQFRTIAVAIKNCLKDIYELEAVNFAYPKFLIDPLSFPDKECCYMGAFLNPLQIIGEFLLQCKVTDFHLEPTFHKDDLGRTYITNYADGAFFHKLVACVKETHGPDVVVLCLDFNFDTMALDGLGKRNLKPFKLRFKNMVSKKLGRQCNILTVGYGPVDLNSKAETLEMLKKLVHTKGKRKEACTYMKRFVFYT